MIIMIISIITTKIIIIILLLLIIIILIIGGPEGLPDQVALGAWVSLVIWGSSVGRGFRSRRLNVAGVKYSHIQLYIYI